MVRSLNKAMLIGNLTRDPELRYTPQGTAVCSFGLATNRGWTTDSGEKKENVEFHRIVAWNKLAELCSQLLSKGRKVFVEGRLSTRSWTGQDGTARTTTEIVIDNMLLLDSKRQTGEGEEAEGIAEDPGFTREEQHPPKKEKKEQQGEEENVPREDTKKKKEEAQVVSDENVDLDDIPF